MKINWNKKYTTVAVYSLLVIAVAVLFVVFVFKFDSFKQGFSWIGEVSAPLIVGIVIAYIVN
ncbi:MAG: AI-2E family transporter, partial [Oscillospiraceae bacterium]